MIELPESHVIAGQMREALSGKPVSYTHLLCLSTRPEFLLLDESFDGLDPAKRILAKKLLLEYVAERGASVIISSHNLHELEDLCDHVGLLDGQKLLLDCSVDDISASPVSYTHLARLFNRGVLRPA